MFNVCPGCGAYSDEKIVRNGNVAVCQSCSHEHQFVAKPLLIVTGSSGSGKTAVALRLASKLTNCVCLESDILWRDEFNKPDDDYKEYRNLWLRVAKNISQCGRPVVLFGSAVPDQFERCAESRYFSSIHYLALVCEEQKLIERLRARPLWRESASDEFLPAFVNFNRTLIEDAPRDYPAMRILDTSSISLEESCAATANWIEEVLSKTETKKAGVR